MVGSERTGCKSLFSALLSFQMDTKQMTVI